MSKVCGIYAVYVHVHVCVLTFKRIVISAYAQCWGMESGLVKQSGLEIEDVIQKILYYFFKYENNSLSTENDDSKKVSNYFM